MPAIRVVTRFRDLDDVNFATFATNDYAQWDGTKFVGVTLPAASDTVPGVVTIGTQTFAGAKTFTGNLTAPIFDKGGQVFNVKAYGAVGDGVTDDRAAIQSVINAVPATGGIVYFPRGIYKIGDPGLTYGDGTSLQTSSKNGLVLLGEGSGSSDVEFLPFGGSFRGTTTLSWFGSAGGTMLTLTGAMSSIRIEGFFFECKGGANSASTAINATHLMNSVFKNLVAQNNTGFAYILTAYQTAFAGMVQGANDNKWDGVANFSPDGNGGGCQLGAASVSGGTLDVARNTFINCRFNHAGTGTGLELRFVDASTFINTIVSKLTVTKTTDSAAYPSGIVFYNCPIISHAAPHVDWNPAAKIRFESFPTADLEPIPTDDGFAGVTDLNQFFGAHSFRDLTTFTVAPRITPMTTGSVLFAKASGEVGQDNSNLFWDDTNNRLGIGTAAPANNLHINGTGNTGFRIQNAERTWLFYNGANGLGDFSVYDVTGGGDRLIVKATSGHGVFTQRLGIGLSVGDTPATQLEVLTADSDTNSVRDMVKLRHTGGIVVAGFGAGILTTLEAGGGTEKNASRISTSWTDATDATPDAMLKFEVAIDGTLTEIMRITPGANNSVAINLGSATAQKVFDIHTTAGGLQSVFNMQNNATAIGTGTGMLFSALQADATPKFIGGVAAVTTDNTNGSVDADLKFRVMTAGTLVDPIIVNGIDGLKHIADYPLTFNESTTTPANPSSSDQGRIYLKADKLIIQFNDVGTVRYKYLDLTGTGVTWVHTTTAP